MKFSPGIAQHIGARSDQQDAFGFSDPAEKSFVSHGGVAAVVADGMGGMENGKEASQTAVRVFLAAYEQKTREEAIPDALSRSIAAANEAVFNLARNGRFNTSTGTTLAAAVIHRGALFWVSAGDSRVYLWRSNQLTRLTEDHVFAADLSRRVKDGEITAECALVHPARDSLTSYLGLEVLPKVEKTTRAFPLDNDDWALICSDGLYRTLSEEEIVASLQNDPQQSVETLVERALAKENPTQDNLTVLALKYQPEIQFERTRPGSFGKRAIAAVIIMAVVVLASLALRVYPLSSLHRLAEQAQAPVKTIALEPAASGPSTVVATKTTEGTSSLPAAPALKAKPPATPPVPKAKAPVEPAIDLFTASRSLIRAGEPSQISWKVSGSPKSIVFYRDNAKVKLPPAIFTIHPERTTTLRLLVTSRSGDEMSKSITIEVKAAQPHQSASKVESSPQEQAVTPAESQSSPVSIKNFKAERVDDGFKLSWIISELPAGSTCHLSLQAGGKSVIETRQLVADDPGDQNYIMVDPSEKTTYALTLICDPVKSPAASQSIVVDPQANH